MKYLILKNTLIDESKFVSEEAADDRLVFVELFTLLNFSCIKISEHLFNIYKLQWDDKYVELSEEVATKGSIHFSEIRPVAKEFEADSSGYGGVKNPVEMTEEITSLVVEFMKIFAKEVVEDEFNKKYKILTNVSELEKASWEIQKHEAREWLTYQGQDGHVTPFLDYVSSERQVDKTTLSNKILEKAENYEDNLSTMLVNLQKILKQFENANTIWDLNILYEDYFNIYMPTMQAVEMGRTVSDTDWTRVNEVKENGFNF
jgi:hypothetical protein